MLSRKLLYFRFNLKNLAGYQSYYSHLSKLANNKIPPAYFYPERHEAEFRDHISFFLAKNEGYRKLSSLTNNLKSISLTDLPILSKEELKKHKPEYFKTTGIAKNRYIMNTTSGSTGEPFVFYSDSKSKTKSDYILNSLYDVWNQSLTTHRLLVIWSKVSNSLKYSIFQKIYKNTFTYNVNSLNINDVAAILNAIQNQNIEIIRAYPSTIYHMIEVILSHRLQNKFNLSSLKIIQVGGEKLWDYQRIRIEKVFKTAQVIDMYGAREVSLMLTKLPGHDSYYPLRKDVIIEIVNDNGTPINNGEGSIVVTDLGNKVYPIIRYNIGDRARIENGMIKEILGRSFEVLTFKNGCSVGASFWTWLLRTQEEIKGFQVLQTGLDSLKIYLIKDGELNLDILTQQIKKQCGEVTIKWAFVNEIKKEINSGKQLLIKKDF